MRWRGRHIAGGGGFTLIELLVVLAIVGVVSAGVGGVFASQNRAYVRQDVALNLEENLRVSLGMITDALRLAGCGVPRGDLDAWLPWAGGLGDSPVRVLEEEGQPDRLSVVACTPVLAELAADAVAGSTTLTLASTVSGRDVDGLLDPSERSLVWIGDKQHALVQAVSGDSITIDTDPLADGDQGLLRPFLAGTPVSRVDVTTFEVTPGSERTPPYLGLDRHHGTLLEIGAGVGDLDVATLLAGRHYRVILTGRSDLDDPAIGAPMTRRVVADVALRN